VPVADVAPVPRAIDAWLPFISATVPLFNLPGTKSHPANLATFFVIRIEAESALPDKTWFTLPLNTASP